ncbi:hypothetical protein HNP69_000881 [Chryseobacterium koreense]|nr:hypothetical protein [Chryseobacterium koreense]
MMMIRKINPKNPFFLPIFFSRLLDLPKKRGRLFQTTSAYVHKLPVYFTTFLVVTVPPWTIFKK